MNETFQIAGMLRQPAAVVFCYWRVLALTVLCMMAPAALAYGDDAEDEHYLTLWERGEYRRALENLEARMAPRLPAVPSFWLRNRGELRFMVGDVDGAIEDFETLNEREPDVASALRLAELYRYRGRTDDFEQALARAERRLQMVLGAYIPQDTLLAAGRIAELQGEDPKRILSTVYDVLMKRWPDYAPGFVAAGRLAQEKGSHALAEQYYRQALEADSADQQALAGLAACYWEGRDPRLEGTLAALEALNPHRPEGVAVRVEMLLDAGRADEALERIGAVLAVNPHQVPFRALEAAALFLKDDEAGMAAAQRRALEFNPRSSEVYRVPGRVASRHYRFREAEGLQRKALAVDPEDHAARAELAINLLRLGRDEEGKEELDRAFAADPYNVRVFNTLKVLDTLAEFETVSSDSFRIQVPRHEAAVLAPAALALLEEGLDYLQKKYDVVVETPVRVQLFDNHDDFMVRSLGLPGNAGHLGICFGQLITMDSPSARSKGTMDWHAVLWHEFAHVITLQKTRNRMPRWLSEGISVHEEALRHPGWGMRLNPGFRDLLADGPLPGASDLELFFTQPKTGQHLMLGYFLAGEFVTHYVDTHGHEALVAALDRIARQETALEALAGAAGVSKEALDEGFRAYTRERFAVLDRLPDFVEAMRRGSEAQARQAWEEAEAAYRGAHAVFPEFSPNNGPLARLAEVYEATGETSKLEEVLRARLELDTTAPAVWRRLAALYREASDWEGVVRAAAGSAAVDPFDAELARMLFEAQRALPAPEGALATAERLIQLDPARAPEYRRARVEALMELGRWAEARRLVVLLLEEHPRYREAQELLIALSERDGP